MFIDMIGFATIVIISSFCLSACAGQKGKLLIDSAQVGSVDIEKQGFKLRHLNMQDATKFVKALNGASSIGLCKYAPEYWIYLRLNDGRALKYRANGRTIKADNDYCFTVSEDDLFLRLWSASESQP